MPTYALPTSDTINASAGLISLMLYVNNATFGWLSRMILIGLYIIVAMAYYRSKGDFIGGLALSGFGTFVVAFLLMVAGFVTGWDLGFAFGVMLLGIVWILIDKQGTA